ncbi:hypothetical protein HDU85_006834 [Gaertneriomyces sp. JEL0708]|nr:hypothetical protein HDU85_006834 [Gaertneriomyces sp. JEL0708]
MVAFPPPLCTMQRHSYDIKEIESLAKLVLELNVPLCPTICEAFERLVELAGTKDFLPASASLGHYLHWVKFKRGEGGYVAPWNCVVGITQGLDRGGRRGFTLADLASYNGDLSALNRILNISPPTVSLPPDPAHHPVDTSTIKALGLSRSGPDSHSQHSFHISHPFSSRCRSPSHGYGQDPYREERERRKRNGGYEGLREWFCTRGRNVWPSTLYISFTPVDKQGSTISDEILALVNQDDGESTDVTADTSASCSTDDLSEYLAARTQHYEIHPTNWVSAGIAIGAYDQTNLPHVPDTRQRYAHMAYDSPHPRYAHHASFQPYPYAYDTMFDPHYAYGIPTYAAAPHPGMAAAAYTTHIPPAPFAEYTPRTAYPNPFAATYSRSPSDCHGMTNPNTTPDTMNPILISPPPSSSHQRKRKTQLAEHHPSSTTMTTGGGGGKRRKQPVKRGGKETPATAVAAGGPQKKRIRMVKKAVAQAAEV